MCFCLTCGLFFCWLLGVCLNFVLLSVFLNLFTASHNRGKVASLVEALRHLMSMRDPVCGAVLDENTAKFKISYEGDTYHFCSLVCKKRFKRQPTKFVK